MHYNITLPERMLLECLSAGDKSLLKIKRECQLEHSTALNILQSLLSKNLIVIKNKKYSLNSLIDAHMQKELYSNSDLLVEVSEIVNSCVRDTVSKSKENPFKMRKVYMTAREEKIFHGLLYNLETFLDSLEINTKANIADQTIIFWGEQNYGKIINDTLTY